MAKYRLVYFDGRGRAEIIRIIFSAAYVQFEDGRIDVKDWPDLKPGKPWTSDGLSLKLCRFPDFNSRYTG